MPSDPLINTDDLHPGDVVLIAVRLKDKTTREPYWWRRFALVSHVMGPRHFQSVTCKLHPGPKDIRMEAVIANVVTKLEPHEWPQGIVSIRTKLIMTGVVSLSSEG